MLTNTNLEKTKTFLSDPSYPKLSIIHTTVVPGHVGIVHVNIPFSLWIDLVDKYGLYVNNVKIMLCCEQLGTEMLLVQNHGYLYLIWVIDSSILYTQSELLHLYTDLYFQATAKLYNLLILANSLETNFESRRSWKEIQKLCDSCQGFSHAPSRFKMSKPTSEM